VGRGLAARLPRSGLVRFICMAASVALHGGLDPETLIGMSRLTHGVDPDPLTASVVALAGYFTYQTRFPIP
jgi:hypothetical protein